MHALNKAIGSESNISSLALATGEPIQRERNVRVIPDYRNSTMWVRIRSSAPRCISKSLLDDLLSVCRATDGHLNAPFRYRVLASERPEVFSLGGDLSFFRDCITQGDRDRLTQYAYSAVEAIWASLTGSGYRDLCSISLVQGEAQGGGFEAAIAAHVVIAEEGTSFGFPECLFGLFPGMGAYHLLAARVSSKLAKKIIGSAKRYSANELFDIGVVDILAAKGKGHQATLDFIESSTAESTEYLRNRFHSITKFELYSDVETWVDQAMRLGEKHLRTIGYILQAQTRHAATHNPSIRVPLAALRARETFA